MTLCILAFFILIQFNLLTILLGMGSMILAFAYPFMKRITYWPQLFLGITFNWGVVLAWSAMNNNITQEIITLYISAIFWTLGYDTIYGTQDMSDDEIIGLKSTSIKFKKNIKLFVSTSYLICFIGIFYLFNNQIGLNMFSIFLIFFALSLFFQIFKFKVANAKTCFDAFKFNNISGMLLFITLLLIN
jgi:4-hydroxybenzoate polyprenyl transferase